MIFKHPAFIFLLALVGISILTNAVIAKSNINYRSINRKLMLQNDSLTGVIIELHKAIGQRSDVVLKGQQISLMK